MAYAFFPYALTILFFLLTRLNYPRLSIPLLLFPHFFLAYLVGRSRDGWLLSLLQLEFPLFSGLLRANCFDFLVGVLLWHVYAGFAGIFVLGFSFFC